MTEDPPPCRCGHPRTVHEHYRDGDDCGACDYCPAYRPDPGPRPSKPLATAVGVCAVALIGLAALAAHTYVGGWAATALLTGIGGAAVWMVVRAEKEDR